VLKKILENIGMSKKKTAKKVAQKTAQKAAKKPAAKKAPAKAPSKTAKKVQAGKAKTAKKVAAKPAKKPAAKATKASAKPAKKVAAAKPSKTQAKVVAKKKVVDQKALKLAAAKEKALAKKKAEAEAKAAKAAAVKAKAEAKKKADAEAKAAKAAALKAKADAKKGGKKGAVVAEEDQEVVSKKRSSDEEEDLDLEVLNTKEPAMNKVVGDLKEALAEDVMTLAEEMTIRDIFESLKGLNLYPTDADECLEKGCDNPATSGGFCRYHYIKSWKDIKKKQTLLSEGRLQSYIYDLVIKYPPKVIEAMLSDFVDEKSFYGVLKEMDIDASEDAYEEADDDLLDDDTDIAFETAVKSKPSFDD
jgi:chemotaxis protein histidine kinase CheA